MTGKTEPQLSSQNVAGFSNISDFPSNSYKHKLYRHTTNVLTTSLAIAKIEFTGRYRTLYSTPMDTHHVIITFGKPLSRCQTHSLKSISHHNFFCCIKKRCIIYIHFSASDKTFCLCVALHTCCVAPAGNEFSNTFSCLFPKN